MQAVYRVPERVQREVVLFRSPLTLLTLRAFRNLDGCDIREHLGRLVGRQCILGRIVRIVAFGDLLGTEYPRGLVEAAA